MGYEVVGIAPSGEEAIRLAVELKPSLILMDIVLKGDMDGIEAARQIRRRYQVPIIYLTAYTDNQTLERAKITEPFGYIVKPFSERELHANIEMALYKHRVEQRLWMVERWFVAATEEMIDAVVAADRDGTITIFNAAAEAITEWKRDEAIGRNISDVLRVINRSTARPITFDNVADGPVICLANDTLLIDKSNRTIPVDVSTSCVRDEEDRPSGTISVLRDATGQRHGAIATLNADVMLAAAQGVSLKGMLEMCTASMVRNLNAAFARIWTISTTGEYLMLQASAGISTNLDNEYTKIQMGTSKIGVIARDRKPHLTNDVVNDPRISNWARDERMVAFAGYPLMVDDRLVGVMAMFSKRKLSPNVINALGSIAQAIALGIERKRLEEQLRQAQKMEAVGQLAGGIAHDFNNLLTIISGYSQLLMSRQGLDEDTRGLVKQIIGAGERAATLTRQLLAFSREQVLEPRVLDLNALLTNLEKMLRRLIGESITLTTALETSAPKVTADPGQLEQVIMNLAVNAADAMPQGGSLTIETRNVELDGSISKIRPTVQAGPYVMLAVSDTGHGMSPEVLAHIYEPFFTTKGPGKGTGLGLATVYGIVRQSGGHIDAYSEQGIGTTFKIYLPRTNDKSTSSTPAADQSMPRGSETVLLVEDEHGLRALARYILHECGYNVIEAGDGAEAILLHEKHDGKIDLLLTDVVLPGMAGRAIAERIITTRPETKVLYMSGYTDDAVIRHGVLQAETSFLQKPFTPSVLAHKVREVLDAS
jgi:PAS domain S-box-containing protein